MSDLETIWIMCKMKMSTNLMLHWFREEVHYYYYCHYRRVLVSSHPQDLCLQCMSLVQFEAAASLSNSTRILKHVYKSLIPQPQNVFLQSTPTQSSKMHTRSLLESDWNTDLTSECWKHRVIICYKRFLSFSPLIILIGFWWLLRDRECNAIKRSELTCWS